MAANTPATVVSTVSGNSRTSGSSGPDGLRIWSCVTCRRRKVRCDRRDPCSNCTRQNIDCHFPVTGRLPRRRPPPSGNAGSGTAAYKQSELLNRLRRLEAVVTELGCQIEDGAKETGFSGGNVSLQISTSRPLEYEDDGGGDDDHEAEPQSDVRGGSTSSLPEINEDFGKLVIAKDGSLQVGNRFWTVFCDEVDNIFRAVEDVEDIEEGAALAAAPDPTPSGPHHASSTGHQSFVLGGGRHGPAEELYPPTDQLSFLWETYKVNIDPFIKVLDISVIEQMIRQIRDGFQALESEKQALILSISFAAVISLEDGEVETKFNMPKPQLLTKYQLGTEIALARAEYLTATSLMTLQAFVIYLSILPQVGAGQMAGNLSGLLVKLAMSQGLHQDGSYNEKTAPREVEIRRRLWWQVCFLDSRSKHPRFPYSMITEDMFDTGLPSYTAELDDVSYTNSSNSSMALCLLSCRIWKLVRVVEKMKHTNRNSTLHHIRTTRQEIDGQLLRNFGAGTPLESLIKTLADLVFSKMEMSVHKKPSSTNLSGTGNEQQPMFNNAVTVIKSVLALKTRQDWNGWRWQVQGNVPWHAFGVALRQLLHQPWETSSEDAWLPTRALFDVISEDPQNAEVVTGAMWKKLSQMVAAVERERQARSMVYASTDDSWDVGSDDWLETVGSMPSLNRTTDEVDSLSGSVLFADSLAVGSGAAPDFPLDIMDWSSTWDDCTTMPWF